MRSSAFSHDTAGSDSTSGTRFSSSVRIRASVPAELGVTLQARDQAGAPRGGDERATERDDFRRGGDDPLDCLEGVGIGERFERGVGAEPLAQRGEVVGADDDERIHGLICDRAAPVSVSPTRVAIPPF